MNMRTTISVLAVAVMATTVIGSTPSQVQEPGRRSEVDKCCAKRIYKCLKDNDCIEPQRQCDGPCDVPEDCMDCCTQYTGCVSNCIWHYDIPSQPEQRGDPLRDCHNQCKNSC
uniref:Gsp_55 putative toxin n=1 Tax=Gemmula speciosa TaxID=439592 RepID=A0A098LXS9_GEMSP